MYELTLTDCETGKTIKWVPQTEEQEVEVATLLMGLADWPSEDLTPSTSFGDALLNGYGTADISATEVA